jgi:hypothetical protein
MLMNIRDTVQLNNRETVHEMVPRGDQYMIMEPGAQMGDQYAGNMEPGALWRNMTTPRSTQNLWTAVPRYQTCMAAIPEAIPVPPSPIVPETKWETSTPDGIVAAPMPLNGGTTNAVNTFLPRQIATTVSGVTDGRTFNGNTQGPLALWVAEDTGAPPQTALGSPMTHMQSMARFQTIEHGRLLLTLLWKRRI